MLVELHRGTALRHPGVHVWRARTATIAESSCQWEVSRSGACRDRTGDLRLAKLCLALRVYPVRAGITGNSRDFGWRLAGIAGSRRGLPATACGMYAG
jgi:hypothetical protein